MRMARVFSYFADTIKFSLVLIISHTERERQTNHCFNYFYYPISEGCGIPPFVDSAINSLIFESHKSGSYLGVIVFM